MKKRIALLYFLCIIALAGHTSTRASMVTTTLPPFEVYVNDSRMDSSHANSPFLFYKDILYCPLTFTLCQNLGLEAVWDQNAGLSLFRVTDRRWNESYQPLPEIMNGGGSRNSNSIQVEIANCAVYINGYPIDQNGEYPFFRKDHLLYMPLTWDIIVNAFNLDFSFSEGELSIAMQPENYGASPNITNDYYWLRAAGYNGSIYFYQTLGEKNGETGEHSSDKVYRVMDGECTEIVGLPNRALAFHGAFVPWGEDTVFTWLDGGANATRNSLLITKEGIIIKPFTPSSTKFVLTDEGAVVFTQGFPAQRNNLRWKLRYANPEDELKEITDADLYFLPSFLRVEAFAIDSWIYLTGLAKNSPLLNVHPESGEFSALAFTLHPPYAKGDGLYKVNLITGECVLLADFTSTDANVLRFSITRSKVDIY